jgi:hypothetical protein
MTYFHVCPIMLDVGSIILPGNWGRVVKMYNRQGINEVFFREYCLEKMRVSDFSDKPSRLDCVFACPDLEGAKQYKKLLNLNTSLIYEVCPTEEHKIHFGDYAKVIPHHNVFTECDRVFREYWMSHEIVHKEVLIGGPIKVLGLQAS